MIEEADDESEMQSPERVDEKSFLHALENTTSPEAVVEQQSSNGNRMSSRQQRHVSDGPVSVYEDHNSRH